MAKESVKAKAKKADIKMGDWIFIIGFSSSRLRIEKILMFNVILRIDQHEFSYFIIFLMF
jgi:hypothetical protein